MAIHPFNLCCGAFILDGFMFDKYFNNAEQTKKCQDFLEQELKSADALSTTKGVACLIVNQHQINYGRELLKKYGWKLVSTTTNPQHAHSTTLYLFVKGFHPVKKEKKYKVTRRVKSESPVVVPTPKRNYPQLMKLLSKIRGKAEQECTP